VRIGRSRTRWILIAGRDMITGYMENIPGHEACWCQARLSRMAHLTVGVVNYCERRRCWRFAKGGPLHALMQPETLIGLFSHQFIRSIVNTTWRVRASSAAAQSGRMVSNQMYTHQLDPEIRYSLALLRSLIHYPRVGGSSTRATVISRLRGESNID
jgi:hypothetical protein